MVKVNLGEIKQVDKNRRLCVVNEDCESRVQGFADMVVEPVYTNHDPRANTSPHLSRQDQDETVHGHHDLPI